MNDVDQFNIEALKGTRKVDEINREFYSQFSYPWPPSSLHLMKSSGLINILNQDIGLYTEKRIHENARIWVAGCGTNQAVITALKFPTCSIIGTDVSTGSLRVCKKTRDDLGIPNLELIERSINDSDFINEFDYVICTGVIHHNADPKITLSRLSQALKPDGIMELMVYNYYHRILPTAAQKAIRLLSASTPGIMGELDIAKKLIAKFPLQNMVNKYFQGFATATEAEMTDAIMQPVEYSYSVQTLNDLIGSCNLEYMLPCMNLFDKMDNNYSWNIEFSDSTIEDNYLKLPDAERWQVANLLMLNSSPMLWFYLQKTNSKHVRKSELEVCNDFLEQKFKKFTATIDNYILERPTGYKLAKQDMNFPIPELPTDQLARTVFQNVRSDEPMKDLLKRLNIKPSFSNVNRIRLNLATVACPYLESIK